MKKIEKDGETIMVSAGLEDMDPESLVEPTQLPPEEVEEREQELGARVALKVNYYPRGNGAAKKSLDYAGILKNIEIHTAPSFLRLELVMSLEDALEFVEFKAQQLYTIRVKYLLNYVHKDEHPDLKNLNPGWLGQVLRGVKITDIKNSTCLCSVLLETNP